MTTTELARLGPVDRIVLEFCGTELGKGEVAPVLTGYVDRGLVRVLDVLFRYPVLLVSDNLWVAPFGSAVRHVGGQWVASGHRPSSLRWRPMRNSRRTR